MVYKSENVKMGSNCNISAETSLRNVTCGDHVIINNDVSLNNVIIGNNCKISRNINIYSPDDSKPVIIGDDVWLSHGVFCEATGGQVKIGSYSVIAHFGLLLTSSGPGKKSFLLDEIYPEELGDIIIGEHCWIGAHTVILPEVHLPQGVVIASNSVVRKNDFKEWSLYAGTPAVYKKAIK
jgi:acetyltransferase-like isoleucine patch superfamily enzyme